ncbi:uncharacterized protein LOC128668680 [Microplitis demolitor]|uniref:uncharacterized protein LOC128668680 n=1 Tax=Microplitis demolitor TaxID=69319 RepID=UPI00235B6C29|nr:uncharacterized protein LOC128668642 isoform X2 [Microplitis demolitor]XP_053598099.1 uncharacterized protein LOC128668680 [Microplitis demolitor]
MNCKVIYRRKNPRLKFSDKIDDGFSYHCYNTIHDTRYIRCYERRAHGCPARGKITNDELDLSIVHNHVRNPQLQKYCIFQDALFIAATARPYRSLKVIFDDLSVQNHEAASQFTWRKMQPLMESWRRSDRPPRPPIPSNLQQFADFLNMPQWAYN